MNVKDRNNEVAWSKGSFRFILNELRGKVGCGCFGNNNHFGV